MIWRYAYDNPSDTPTKYLMGGKTKNDYINKCHRRASATSPEHCPMRLHAARHTQRDPERCPETLRTDVDLELYSQGIVGNSAI